MGVWAVS